MIFLGGIIKLGRVAAVFGNLAYYIKLLAFAQDCVSLYNITNDKDYCRRQETCKLAKRGL